MMKATGVVKHPCYWCGKPAKRIKIAHGQKARRVYKLTRYVCLTCGKYTDTIRKLRPEESPPRKQLPMIGRKGWPFTSTDSVAKALDKAQPRE